jgi:hypothetical protein
MPRRFKPWHAKHHPIRLESAQACPAGSYVRTATSYKTDFHTSVSGSCDVYIYDSQIPGCVYHSTQNRGIGSTTIEEIGAFGWTVVYPNPNNFPAQLDTRPSGTSSPDSPSWTFYYEGDRTVDFKSNITVTACNLQPNFVLAQAAFTAVKCVPNTTLSGSRGVVRGVQ